MKTKEIIICLVALIVLAVTIVMPSAYATGGVNDLNELLGNNNTNGTTDLNEFENIPIANEIEGPANVNVEINTANVNTNVTKFPDTGVDYSIILVIAVCAISSVYAYKKIKDYTIR